MANVSISDILALLGEGGLEDRFQERKARFRRFLAQDKWRPADFAGWIEECLEKGSSARPSYFHALQDIVVSVGIHLGMEVEYGTYGQGPDIGFDGKWSAYGGRTILLEVKASPWPVPSVHQLGSYMDRYVPRYDVAPSKVYGLFVVGPGDCAPLLDQIKGSEYRSRMKLIQVADLLRLWELQLQLRERSDPDAVKRTIQNLLLPFESVNVGSLLTLIEEVARRSTADAGGRAETAGVRREWGRSELTELLEATTPAQRTLLAALASSRAEPVGGRKVVELMRRAAERCANVLDADTISHRTFAGALASLLRTCHQQDREPIIQKTSEGYRIAPRYMDWIVQWASGEGLLMEDASPPLALEIDPFESEER